MCGICGWIGNGTVGQGPEIEGMVRALMPRGPDDSGLWRGKRPVVLGHTRLSIIDVDGSRQPVENEDGTVVATFNGEIYNFQELRRELSARGHRFRTAGDSEVLVHLYEEHGAAMVERLDGMFAFAIYDQRRHSLLLARDRIGIKPLYYHLGTGSESLIFGSDLRAMLAHPAVPRQLESAALAQYLHFGYVVPPLTWLAGVAQLLPGQLLEWRPGHARTSRYYEWQYDPDPMLDDVDQAREALSATLASSVSSHLIADVPLGAFLSGGIDSAAVAGAAQRARPSGAVPLHSLTVGLRGTELDESARADAAARLLGTRHTLVEGERLPFGLASLVRLVDALGEPFGDDAALSMDVLCREARQHMKVALSGDGGDELFLGYGGFRKQRLARRLRLAPRPLRQAMARFPSGSSDVARRVRKYSTLSLHDDPGLIVGWARRWEPAMLATLVDPALHGTLLPNRREAFPEIRRLIGNGERGGLGEQQLRFHMLVDLPCDCLLKVDRVSMAHGIEVRVPLLSNAMLDFGSRLPLGQRRAGRRDKEPLRSVAESLVPSVRAPSPKMGFTFPVDGWMQHGLADVWREAGIVRTLGRLGFSHPELERLIRRYAAAGPADHDFAVRHLASRLYDLTLLGLWADRERIAL